MTDEQVRTLVPELLERAIIEEHLADGCNDDSPLQRGHLAWAQSLRAIADHLEAGLADRVQAELDREDAERLDALIDLIAASAERGEAVELDGRCGMVTLVQWPTNASNEAPMDVGYEGLDLRAAIDAALEASGECR